MIHSIQFYRYRQVENQDQLKKGQAPMRLASAEEGASESEPAGGATDALTASRLHLRFAA
jgi:hypothetical protein